MNFTQAHFLVFFFPTVLAVHLLLGAKVGERLFGVSRDALHRTQKAFLLAASYYFYAMWNPVFLTLIFGLTTLDYLVGIGLERTKTPGGAKRLLTASIIANVGFLAYFKYTNFFVDSLVTMLNAGGFEVAPRHFAIVLPVGISFHTFQSMSYVIDVYRKEIRATRSWLDFYLFVAFFPQLVAGPIVRAVDFLPQLVRPPVINRARFIDGLERFMIGLFKKCVIANEIAHLNDMVYGDLGHFSSLEVFLAAVGFCFQIYADFSGYSDMAIGSAKMLGYDFCENFRLPYLATSVTEYWRRWHMSLSTWFRDYFYIPIGGNRSGPLKTYRNLIATFLVTGLWHGANWTFVLFGAWNGMMLIVERLATNLLARRGKRTPNAAIPGFFVIGFVWTALSTVVSFIFFRAENWTHVVAIFSRLAANADGSGIFLWRKFLWVTFLIVLYHGLAYLRVRERLTRALPPLALVFCRGLIYAFFAALMLAFSPLDGRAFIYFQF